MEEMSMRERIARALCERQFREGLSESDATAPETTDALARFVTLLWRDHLAAADAVLEALREPDEGMIDCVAGQEQTRSDAKRIWRAMIDHARNDGR